MSVKMFLTRFRAQLLFQNFSFEQVVFVSGSWLPAGQSFLQS